MDERWLERAFFLLLLTGSGFMVTLTVSILIGGLE